MHAPTCLEELGFSSSGVQDWVGSAAIGDGGEGVGGWFSLGLGVLWNHYIASGCDVD